MIKKILVIHGPNLNLLGEREPGVYGSAGIDVLNSNIIDRANEQQRAAPMGKISFEEQSKKRWL